MKRDHVLALDQGTTSCRAIVFDSSSSIVAVGQREFKQIYPKPGWVEHDAGEIWETQLAVAREAISKAHLDPGRIAGIGITNQRETIVLWDRETGEPVYNAIVWQCRRGADICGDLKKQGVENMVRAKTGLLLDPYFSASKIKWLFDAEPELRRRAENGELRLGTIDSWLIYKLTGEHATDPGNASRTLLYDIRQSRWDPELTDLFDVPESILPAVKPSSGVFGVANKDLFGAEIPVSGVAGDQQAALFGQVCFSPGDMKCTYGTGAFILANTGKTPRMSRNKLLTTIAWDLGDGPVYALEGSVFIAGAVIQWLRDGLKIIDDASETEALATSVEDSGGVYFVPAFVGLGAPHWVPEIRGSLLGLTRGATRAHVVRAALESIPFQCRDLIKALEGDTGAEISELRVDGGVTANAFLTQFQSDVLGKPVIVPEIKETTALGASYLAGLATGVWGDLEELTKQWRESRRYNPVLTEQDRTELIHRWETAVAAAKAFQP